MNLQTNVPLSRFSTMRLGGNAKFLTEVTSEDELLEAVEFAREKALRIVNVGVGSNIIWTNQGFDGLVIVHRNSSVSSNQEDGAVKFEVGSGKNWDEFVAETVEQSLSGIEALSLIPGTCGAAPVQNIGAYGQEVADSITEVRAYDLHESTFVTLDHEACGFHYRQSIFNTSEKGRYLITKVTFRLHASNPQPPFYKDVDSYFESKDIMSPTPQQLREAVIAIRSNKLPDPSEVANNGSFFKNPIVEHVIAAKLKEQSPDLPAWELEDGRVKISAAWLIEQAGFNRGYYDDVTGMATWKNQSLVLVNQQAKSSDDVFAFRDNIIDSVSKKFGIILEQEPETIT